MRILLAKMAQSPYNRSIWMGLSAAFTRMGHKVTEIDAALLPTPETLGPNRPDLLFAVHGGNTDPKVLLRYRDAGIATAVYLLDEPYEVDASTRWAQAYEWVFSVDRNTVPVHSEYANALHLPLAYDDGVFSPSGASIESDILLLGSPFPARLPFLKPIRDRWGERVTWVGPGWSEFSHAGRHIAGFVTPEDCARFYRGAKIVINIHRDPHWSHFGNLNRRALSPSHLNPRFWEAGACRTCQLCSWRNDLKTFAPRTPSFHSPAELTDRLDYLLSNEEARRDSAKRLYGKVRRHTYLDRATTVLKAIGKS